MTRRPIVAATLLLALLLALVSACSNGSSPSSTPTTTITLARPDPSNLPDTTKTVHLSVGQVLGVQAVHTDAVGYWKQTNGGNDGVLTQDGPASTTGSCPTDVVGCGSTSMQLYRAASAGTSTVEWSFVGLGPGAVIPGRPAMPCQGFPGQQCPVGRVRITVTVD
jgi:ABC-type glycerol-3-phosphate transport system substrate-binding protein